MQIVEFTGNRYNEKCKAAGIEPLQEKDLSKKVATDADSLEHAGDLLAHSNLKTTREPYRLIGDKVMPLKHRYNRAGSDNQILIGQIGLLK